MVLLARSPMRCQVEGVRLCGPTDKRIDPFRLLGIFKRSKIIRDLPFTDKSTTKFFEELFLSIRDFQQNTQRQDFRREIAPSDNSHLLYQLFTLVFLSIIHCFFGSFYVGIFINYKFIFWIFFIWKFPGLEFVARTIAMTTFNTKEYRW